MKYDFKKHCSGCWWVLNTDFEVTETLCSLVKISKGVNWLSSSRYNIEFTIGELFCIEEVKSGISKILDAYIAANPNADKAEDFAIKQFATTNEQFKFLNNYEK